ncbi:hypothetical protein VE25_15655 [Devosia geojensis]|uniref:Methyltransferase small domain-containing protein n=1 Tax=Devosia geojensis TaxID=443610 RepID=A0A0F5FQN1_9HYPH|nr:hypothetical protein VE25_15655 [Devosia geojensis]
MTHDAFLGGRLTVSQPRNGFRAGLDSVLLGAAVRIGTQTLLDLGAGVGAAGLVALAHDDGLSATLVERDAQMLALAEANIEANGFTTRARTILLDVTAKGAERSAAGLGSDSYGAVIANPPFFDAAAGTRAAAPRADARHMDEGALDLWVRTAATSAAPGGEIVFVYPAAGLGPLLAAFDQRFGAITILPLCPRPGEPASRVLARAVKGSRAPLTLLASRPIHADAGRAFTPEFDAILKGMVRLDW